MKKSINNIYDKMVTYENVLNTWNIVKKTCNDRDSVYRFHFNKMTNVENIYRIIKEKKYTPFKYSLFMIFEPKPRLVMNQSIFDKVVNHFVSNYYLLPFLEKKIN